MNTQQKIKVVGAPTPTTPKLTGQSLMNRPFAYQYIIVRRKRQIVDNCSSLLLLDLAAQARELWHHHVLATLHSDDSQARQHLALAQKHRLVWVGLAGALVGGMGR
jgi:hypothetical protein